MLTVLAALPAGGQRAELEKRIRRTTLPNGLDVIVVENPGVPLVTIEAVVRNGAFVQAPEIEGLAHMYEHMIFGANSTWPDAQLFQARLSELGADFNGTTSEERVNYYLTLSSDSLEPGLRALAAALRSPLFRPDELAREKEVVLGEYDRNEADPFFSFQQRLGRALWGPAWTRKNSIGRREILRSVTPQQMREIQRRYYVPNNTALIVAGDVSANRVFALARSAFGEWARGADPFAESPIPAVPPLASSTAIITEQPVGSALVMRQWHGPSARRDVADTYAADVFSDVLNEPGSRFQRRLVESGLFTTLRVNYYTLDQTGPITIFGETRPEKLREAVRALDEELRRVVSDPAYLDPAVFESVKRQRVAGTLFSLERASGFAHQLGFWWSVTGLDYFLGYVDAMAAQTPADLRRYAQRYIVGKPHVTGVLLPTGATRALGLTEAEMAR